MIAITSAQKSQHFCGALSVVISLNIIFLSDESVDLFLTKLAAMLMKIIRDFFSQLFFCSIM